ncbi:MAG TPA: hypothetical protein VHO69_02955, partial [Phototrophicaceae bacterium]|nr:hypothetical protein [Phototrophicaceae bacterium]
MTKSRTIRVWARSGLSLVALLLAACTLTQQPPIPMVTVTPPPSPTSTPTPTVTLTPAPTLTPTPFVSSLPFALA